MDPSQWNFNPYHKLGSSTTLPSKPSGRFDLPLLDQTTALSGLGALPSAHSALAASRSYPALPGHYQHPINNMPSLFDQMNQIQTGLSSQYGRPSVQPGYSLDSALYAPPSSGATSIATHDPKYTSKSAFETADSFRDAFSERPPQEELPRSWGLSSFLAQTSSSFGTPSLDFVSTAQQAPPPAHSGLHRTHSGQQFRASDSVPSLRAPSVPAYNRQTSDHNVRLPSLFQNHDSERESVISHKPSSRHYSEPAKSNHTPPKHQQPLAHESQQTQGHSNVARPGSRAQHGSNMFSDTSLQRSVPGLPEYSAQQREFTTAQHQSYYNESLFTKPTSSPYTTQSSYSSANYDPISPVMPDHLKQDEQSEVFNTPAKTDVYGSGRGNGDYHHKGESMTDVYNTPAKADVYAPAKPVYSGGRSSVDFHRKSESLDEVFNAQSAKAEVYNGGRNSVDFHRKSESFNLDQCLPHDKTSERQVPLSSHYQPMQQVSRMSQSPSQTVLSQPPPSPSSHLVGHHTPGQMMDLQNNLTPTPIQAVADSTTKKGKPKQKRSRKKKNEQPQLKPDINMREDDIKMSMNDFNASIALSKDSMAPLMGSYSNLTKSVDTYLAQPMRDGKTQLDNYVSQMQKGKTDDTFTTLSHDVKRGMDSYMVASKNTLDSFTTLDTHQVSNTLHSMVQLSKSQQQIISPSIVSPHQVTYEPVPSVMTSPQNPMVSGVMGPMMDQPSITLHQPYSTLHNMTNQPQNAIMSQACSPNDILAQSVDAAGLADGVDVFDSPMSYNQPHSRTFLTKAAQKEHTSIIMEDDDEFGHLANPAPAPTSNSKPPEPPKPKPMTAFQKSSFQNSFLSFLQGAKQETLSEVTMTPAINKPQLPKYIPEENPRRPAVAPPKKVAAKEIDDNSESDVGDDDDDDEGSDFKSVSSQSDFMDESSPPRKAIKINIKPPKLKASTKRRFKALSARVKKIRSSTSVDEGTVSDVRLEEGEMVIAKEATPPPRRVQSTRKAKQTAANKKKGRNGDGGVSDEEVVAVSSAEEKEYDSDKDPAWNPLEDAYVGPDDETNARKRPARRGRTRSTRKRSTNHSTKEPGEVKPPKMQKQAGGFFLDRRTELDPENYCIWKRDSGKLIQKYEATYDGEKMYHKASGVFSNLTDVMKPHFEPIRVNLVAGNLQFVEVADEFKPSSGGDSSNISVDDLAEPFRVFMQIMISQALAPGFLRAVEEEQEEFYIGPLKKIDAAIKDKRKEVSRVLLWNSVFQKSVETRPHLDVEATSGKQKCQVSHGGAVEATKCIQLHGDQYVQDSLDTTPNSETQEFFACDAVCKHLEEFHRLCHFKFSVFKRCVAKVDILRGSNDDIENIEILDACLQNKNWIQQIFSDLTTLLNYSVGA